MSSGSRSYGPAWLALAVALAAHVADEALTDFLSLYNPTVLAIRSRYAWFPMPTFTWDVWLTGLVLLVIVLVAVSPLAFNGSRTFRAVAYPFGALMFLNGVAHLAASVYGRRWMPGTTTAPLLLGASMWLFRSMRSGATG